MTEPLVRLCLVLHNHQPVGNFDHVFESAYQESYRPFLDVFETYSDLRISLHVSGSLAEWLDQRHPEYFDRLAALVRDQRIEIIGGAYYEPILTMLGRRDRIGQIRDYRSWLEARLSAEIRGAWIPERVWEASLTSDLAEAGVEYTLLDDFHFRCAGLAEDPLHGYFITEDAGRMLRVFPGSEPLRYLIPFREPQETIDSLRALGERHPGTVAVFGDDGEKFGTWPQTHEHVYRQGWLRRFFDALVEQQAWLQTLRLSDAVAQVPPAGRIYLPDASYREMTEWALPVPRQQAFERLVQQIESDPRWPEIQPFLRGGLWRNFKVKYSEANELYARMVDVSRRLEEAEPAADSPTLLQQARRHLYRGQCNCAYWHGAFGGLYLPHLRNAVYAELIRAEDAIDRALGRPPHWVEASADDFNFDGRVEVRLANDRLAAWIAPTAGGQLYELDVRGAAVNLLATMQRRPEAYHDKVRRGATNAADAAASIHDRIVFKQEGLERQLIYDPRPPKSLIDHFWLPETTAEELALAAAEPLGDFADGVYQSRIRRNPGRIQVHLQRTGRVDGRVVTITKGITLEAGRDELEIAYLLEGLPQERGVRFAVECHFAALPADAEDRFFQSGPLHLGPLQTQLNLDGVRALALCDRWLGLEVHLDWDRPTGVWTYPIQTVSQSEGGFERVHQSVAVVPNWLLRGDARGRWSMVMRWRLASRVHPAGAEETAPAIPAWHPAPAPLS